MNVEYEIDGINESIDRSETVIKLVPSDQLERDIRSDRATCALTCSVMFVLLHECIEITLNVF
ncbi:hypothetical protein AF72_05940 [Xylella taiwanensis]|uniref:Uncharacterized protein n=1 Tax=Xylella taiwanensis TaxID=1444770 RepID=Z9JIU6_9GAMM|nr:hypothetical protein AF72_05940 [Xylella taiwanensis]